MLIEKIPNRDFVILLEDFKAKTGTGSTEFPEQFPEQLRKIST